MNKAKIEMMEALKGLLETYGAEGVFQVLTEATENLVGASNEANECYALSAANEIRKAARAVKRAELKIEASLARSLEVPGRVSSSGSFTSTASTRRPTSTSIPTK